MNIDFNTLVPGDVSLPNWRYFDLANAPYTLSNAGILYGPAETAPSAVLVNPGGVTPGTGRLACPVGIPNGVTAVRLQIRAALPTGVSSSTLNLELRTAAGALVSSGTVVLTATMTTYTVLSSATVAWPTEYVVNCYTNSAPSSVQAQAIIEWIAVRPVTFPATAWRSDLYRIEIGPELIQGGYALFASSRYWSRPAYSQTMFTISAPRGNLSFYFSQYCRNAAGNGNGCPVRVDGTQYPTLVRSTGTTSTGVWDFVPVTLAAAAALDVQPTILPDLVIDADVEIHSAAQTNSAGWTKPAFVDGTWPTAIYVPSGYRVRASNRVNMREPFLYYADSIGAGIGVTNPEFSGIAQSLRRAVPHELICECAGGRSLQGDVVTQTYQQLAAQLAKQRPRIMWFQVGTNDYGGAGAGTSAVAAWQTLLTNLLTTLHALVPDMTIFVQSITSRTFEAANNFGETAAQYRTAASAAATAAGTYCQFVDASAWINPATQTSDGLHLNSIGQSIYVGKVISTLQAAGFM